MDGRAYTGTQGTGLATVLGDSQAIDNLAKGNLIAKSGQGQKKKGAGFNTDEVWHYYTGATNNAINKWYDNTAKLMTEEGIEDIWESSNPKAVQQQIAAGKLRAGIDNIKQAQSMYLEATKDIGTRGDEYTEEYKDAVVNFPKSVSFEQMVSGQFDFPVAKFKEPVTVYNNFVVKGAARLKKEYGDEYIPDEAYRNEVFGYFDSPENKTNERAIKQMLVNVSDNDRRELARIKEDQGFDEMWQALAFKNLKAQHHFKSQNASEIAAKISGELPTDDTEWKTKEEGVTIAGSRKGLTDKGRKLAEKSAKSFFATNAYSLKDEGFMDQLGVDMNQSIAGREKDAIAALTKMAIDYVPTETSSERLEGDGSGMTKEERTQNFDDWYADLTSSDGKLSTHAANWLFGKNIMGKVRSAKVVDYDDPASSVIKDLNLGQGFSNMRMMEVVYDNTKEAEAAKEKSLKLMRDSGAGDEAIDKLAEYYDNKASGRRAFIPITEETRQVFKEVHRGSAYNKKEPYKREMASDPLNLEKIEYVIPE
jgi:hypothetical protein